MALNFTPAQAVHSASTGMVPSHLVPRRVGFFGMLLEENTPLRRVGFSASAVGVAQPDRVIYNDGLPSGSSSVVERDLAKVDVAGSTPVSRSIFSSIYLPMDFFRTER
jgi:hypothetical protein